MQRVADQVYASGKVRRWHTHPSLTQTIADHSWGVAVILGLIHPKPTVELLMEALLHDAHEIVSGDTPSPAKDANSRDWEDKIERDFRAQHNLPAPILSYEDHSWLKLADMIEAKMFLELSSAQDKMSMAAIQRIEKIIATVKRNLEDQQ